MKLSPLSSSLSSAVITMIELPWWQVLIDGPIIHYWVTATLVLALTGILLDGCHRGTQSSCNLTVEVSHKHNHTCTKPFTHTQEQRQALAQAHPQTLKAHTDVHMYSVQRTFIETPTHTKPQTHAHTCTQYTQSVSMTCDWHILTI